MGFKGGFAAFTDSFMKTMDAENERKRLEVERADQKSRQAENDQWTRDERALQVKNRTEAEDVKKKLIEASAPVVEDVAQHGPVTPGMELAPIKVSRPKMLDEKLDSIARVYEVQGNLPEALKYQALSDSEKMRRSAKGFMDLQASAKDATPDQVINSAISIFNNDPSLGHIENHTKNTDGTYTMDIFNKKTGQRVTQTFKPEDILSGLRMHYDQAGALKSQADDLERSRKITSHREGSTLTDGNGRIVGTTPFRPLAPGKGSAGSNGKAPYSELGEAWDSMIKSTDTKFSSPDAAIAARDMAQRIHTNNNGKVPPELAIKTAVAVAANPALEVPEVDLETGMIHMVVKDPRHVDVITRPNYATAASLKDVKPETAKALIASMEQKLPPEEFQIIRDVAFDRSGKAARRYLDARVPEMVAQLKSNPAYKTVPDQKVNEIARNYVEQTLAPILLRKADLISRYDNQRGKEGSNPLTYTNGVRNAMPKRHEKQLNFDGGIYQLAPSEMSISP